MPECTTAVNTTRCYHVVTFLSSNVRNAPCKNKDRSYIRNKARAAAGAGAPRFARRIPRPGAPRPLVGLPLPSVPASGRLARLDSCRP
jgi:hypothetical protein